MKSIHHIRFVAGLAIVLSGLACSRNLPSEWPEASPASSAGKEAPKANVTLALDGDPPLPGEPAEGWFGLQEAPSEDPHAHHRHHGGHAAPAPQDGGHHGH